MPYVRLVLMAGANVNFCQLTERAFKAELMPQLLAQLPRLEYLNLNDNPKLCETQATRKPKNLNLEP